MYRRILVPLDGSPGAEAALEVACEMLHPAGGLLLLVRMRQSGEPAGGVEHRYLESVASRWGTPVRQVEFEVLDPYKRVAHVISEAASRLNCELVVMVSHGRSGWKRVGSGSVAEELARRCSRPVVILGPESPEVRRIKQELQVLSEGQ